MEFLKCRLPEVVLLKPKIHKDDRGFFFETFRQNEFEEYCSPVAFVQENQSASTGGVLRGLHAQTERPQGKLVRVLTGSIYDVAVDVRIGSNSFGEWVGAELSSENNHQLWIPPGFAHGFYVTSCYAEIAYKCTDYYCPRSEYVLSWKDPNVAIDWPISANHPPLISSKDKLGLGLDDLPRVSILSS